MNENVKGIKKGDIVMANPDHCYICYSQFIWRHLRYAIRWAYRCFPSPERKYKVMGVYRHVMRDRYDASVRCVVIQDCINGQIFLMGEEGLSKTVGNPELLGGGQDG